MQQIKIDTQTGTLCLDPLVISHFSMANDRYCWMSYLNGKKQFIQCSIRELCEALPNPPFMQVHKDHIINVDQIAEINTSNGLKVIMLNGFIVEGK